MRITFVSCRSHGLQRMKFVYFKWDFVWTNEFVFFGIDKCLHRNKRNCFNCDLVCVDVNYILYYFKRGHVAFWQLAFENNCLKSILNIVDGWEDDFRSNSTTREWFLDFDIGMRVEIAVKFVVAFEKEIFSCIII
jgi:hypothetical protein